MTRGRCLGGLGCLGHFGHIETFDLLDCNAIYKTTTYYFGFKTSSNWEVKVA